MCGSIKYTDKLDKTWTMYFLNPKAALPVLNKNGEIVWVTWSKRKGENVPAFPNVGRARLDSIKDTKWQRYQPRPFMIPTKSFMEKNHDKNSYWFN